MILNILGKEKSEIEMKKGKENDIKAVKKGNLSCLRQEFED